MKKVLSLIGMMLGSLIILSLIAGWSDSRNIEKQADRYSRAMPGNGNPPVQKVAEIITSDGQDFIIIDMSHKKDYEGTPPRGRQDSVYGYAPDEEPREAPQEQAYKALLRTRS